jgi:glycosyltransferase involved in cell wall biosynthesis
VPEVIEQGRNGWIVASVEDAVRAVERAVTHPRALVRQAFEERFTAERMAKEYVAAYEEVLAEGSRRLFSAGILDYAEKSPPVAAGQA